MTRPDDRRESSGIDGGPGFYPRTPRSLAMTVGEIEKDLNRTAASYYSAARIRRVHADKIKSKIPSKQADSAALKRLAEEEHQKGALNFDLRSRQRTLADDSATDPEEAALRREAAEAYEERQTAHFKEAADLRRRAADLDNEIVSNKLDENELRLDGATYIKRAKEYEDFAKQAAAGGVVGGIDIGVGATNSQILVDQTGISQGVTDLRQRIDKAHAINAEARQLTASVAEAFQGDTSDAFQQRRQVLLERNEQLADVTSGVVQTVSQVADEAIDADRSRATQY